MKLKVTKYHPNFVEVDKEIEQIIEFDSSDPISFSIMHSPYDIWTKVDYLKDKIGKLDYRFHTFTQTLIVYDCPNYDSPIPIAWVELLEI